MFTKIIRWLHWFSQTWWFWTNVQSAILQQYREFLLQQERYQNTKRLNQFEYQVFSQNGEDGILSEIFKRIEETNRIFVEIGVGSGLENNTTFLLLKDWKGAWIEGNRRSVAFIKKHFAAPLYEGRLSVLQEFVSRENAEFLLTKLGIPIAPDLLSIDIDRNTYYVLETILRLFRPRVIVVEYNGLFPPNIDWKVDYSPTHLWNRTSYFGASLKAYELLGQQFGYSLVGCDLCGINAFLVRADLCENKFETPFTAENHYEPLRDFMVYRAGYPRAFTDLV
jgi:hypothetical protein